MTRILLAATALGLLLPALAGPTQAQTTKTSGAVRGHVQGPDGEPAAGAVVLLRDVERGATREARTDREGRFTFGLLLPGTYLYAVRSEAPEAGVAGPVRVRAGERSTVRVALEYGEHLYAGTGEELDVSVSGSGAMEFVGGAEIENLPTEGRDWRDLFLLSGLVSLAEDGGFRLTGGAGLPLLVDGQQR